MNKSDYKITIDKIPDYQYEGYIWYSDQTIPKIINGRFDTLLLTKLPFVIEGSLYAKGENISIQIKNIDGEYQIFQFDLSNINIDPVEYIGHDLNGKNYLMIEKWEEDKDKLLEGMKTLRPAWSAFAGFVESK